MNELDKQQFEDLKANILQRLDYLEQSMNEKRLANSTIHCTKLFTSVIKLTRFCDLFINTCRQ